MMKRVLSFSGGKDSTAMYLLALERGVEFIAIFADTGHEHPSTLDYVRDLPARTGGPAIRWVKADFTADITRKRRFVAERWPEHGVPADRIARAQEVLHPTGVPFLDLCLLKGRFPSTRSRFCSAELKHRPIFEQVIAPLLDAGHLVVSWQGVRADESASRANLPVRDRDHGGHINFRPLLRWTADDIFAMHRRHGIEPNPLYRQGCSRVGCLPCIHVGKAELRNIAARYPEEIERVASWESLVSAASKRGISTFFSFDKIPGYHQDDLSLPMPTVKDVVEWSKTSRGGRQFDLEAIIAPAPCASTYGLCE
jgi:3'-phosphoadenosine 5'-phosphosulfate sulfotransferase (PAPS reductase)/FAD synthetase